MSNWPYGTLLSRLPTDARSQLLELGVRRTARPGEVLIRQGAEESHVILLRGGFAKVTAATADGREALLAIRVSGDILGEMSALNHRPRSATVVAGIRLALNVIHHRDLERFLIARPAAALELAGMVGDRLRWANQFRVEFTAYPAKVRLARVLVKIATTYGQPSGGGLVVGVGLTQIELASLCGAAEVTVQKALHDFREQELVNTGYRHITVLNLAALRQAAELDDCRS